jgi:hypothetical protein
MDCRESGSTVPNDHGVALATGCKWVVLLRLDTDGYFRNNKKNEMFSIDAPDGYYIAFYDSPFVISVVNLDPEGRRRI